MLAISANATQWSVRFSDAGGRRTGHHPRRHPCRPLAAAVAIRYFLKTRIAWSANLRLAGALLARVLWHLNRYKMGDTAALTQAAGQP